jgi:hypothetical protein
LSRTPSSGSSSRLSVEPPCTRPSSAAARDTPSTGSTDPSSSSSASTPLEAKQQDPHTSSAPSLIANAASARAPQASSTSSSSLAVPPLNKSSSSATSLMPSSTTQAVIDAHAQISHSKKPIQYQASTLATSSDKIYSEVVMEDGPSASVKRLAEEVPAADDDDRKRVRTEGSASNGDAASASSLLSFPSQSSSVRRTTADALTFSSSLVDCFFSSPTGFSLL